MAKEYVECGNIASEYMPEIRGSVCWVYGCCCCCGYCRLPLPLFVCTPRWLRSNDGLTRAQNQTTESNGPCVCALCCVYMYYGSMLCVCMWCVPLVNCGVATICMSQKTRSISELPSSCCLFCFFYFFYCFICFCRTNMYCVVCSNARSGIDGVRTASLLWQNLVQHKKKRSTFVLHTYRDISILHSLFANTNTHKHIPLKLPSFTKRFLPTSFHGQFSICLHTEARRAGMPEDSRSLWRVSPFFNSRISIYLFYILYIPHFEFQSDDL